MEKWKPWCCFARPCLVFGDDGVLSIKNTFDWKVVFMSRSVIGNGIQRHFDAHLLKTKSLLYLLLYMCVCNVCVIQFEPFHAAARLYQRSWAWTPNNMPSISPTPVHLRCVSYNGNGPAAVWHRRYRRIGNGSDKSLQWVRLEKKEVYFRKLPKQTVP